MKLVVVKWIDAHTESGWSDNPEGHMPVACETVGYIVKNTDEYICIAQTMSADRGACNLMAIPAGMIQEVREI